MNEQVRCIYASNAVNENYWLGSGFGLSPKALPSIYYSHFTIPQFAKSVLDTFRAKMDEVKSLVNVYYENIDAILIDENDYNKLLKLGYIGEELGKFKIEHVFNEIAVKTARKYVATLEDGTIFYHCVKDSVNYDDFVNEVKQMIE